jgi:hypothetical protein
MVTRNQESGRRIKKAGWQGAAMLLISAGLYFWGRPIWALAVLGLALLVLGSGLFLPPVYHLLEKFEILLAEGITRLILWTVMMPFYYLVFTTGRLVLLLRRLDPLQLKHNPEAVTYWREFARTHDPARYHRQF